MEWSEILDRGANLVHQSEFNQRQLLSEMELTNEFTFNNFAQILPNLMYAYYFVHFCYKLIKINSIKQILLSLLQSPNLNISFFLNEEERQEENLFTVYRYLDDVQFLSLLSNLF